MPPRHPPNSQRPPRVARSVRCQLDPGGSSPSPTPSQQLDALDRPLLTRRDLEALFGVSRARAATLMRAFGAEWTGSIRTLPRTTLLRQLRRLQQDRPLPGRRRPPRPGVDRTAPGPPHRDPCPGPRGRPSQGRLASLPAGVSVQPRSNRGARHQRKRCRRPALRPRPGPDPRLRPLRNPHRGGRGIGMSAAGTPGSVAPVSAQAARIRA